LFLIGCVIPNITYERGREREGEGGGGGGRERGREGEGEGGRGGGREKDDEKVHAVVKEKWGENRKRGEWRERMFQTLPMWGERKREEVTGKYRKRERWWGVCREKEKWGGEGMRKKRERIRERERRKHTDREFKSIKANVGVMSWGEYMVLLVMVLFVPWMFIAIDKQQRDRTQFHSWKIII
jgi:hypothetical protein